MIHNLKPCYLWEPDEWPGQHKENVKKMQNKLKKYKIIDVIGNLIMSSEYEADLKYEAVLLCIGILLGGNIEVQEAFHKFLIKDSQNLFILSLKEMVDKAFSIVENRMNEQNVIFENMIMEDQQTVPAESDVDGENSKEINVDEYINRIVQVYHLLQLFCEGHNQVLQNYLRQQIQNGKINGKSFNFISHSAHIFGKLIKFINIKCINLGDQIIEFLIESLQGPCKANQSELARNKIVFCVKDFLSQFVDDIDYDRRGFKSVIPV